MKQIFLLFALCVCCQQTNAQLRYRHVLSNAAEIKMPVDFKIMEERMINFKYPKNPPAEVYTDSAARVNLNFKITKQPLPESKVYIAGEMVEKQICAAMSCEKISTEKITVNGSTLYVFTIITQAADVPIYNKMFVFSLNGMMTLGNFNCVIRLRNEWESAANEMVRSLKLSKP